MVPIFSTDDSLLKKYSCEVKCKKFLSSRKDILFEELVAFAIEVGFEGEQDASSHWVGRHPTHHCDPPSYNKVNFQKMKGSKKAKPYQVKQLIYFIYNATPKKE